MRCSIETSTKNKKINSCQEREETQKSVNYNKNDYVMNIIINLNTPNIYYLDLVYTKGV